MQARGIAWPSARLATKARRWRRAGVGIEFTGPIKGKRW